MINLKKYFFLLSVFLSCVFGNNLFAQAKISWTGNVDSNWENPANWQGGSVPASGDDITIDSVGNYNGAKAHPSITTPSSFTPNKIKIVGGKLQK